MFAQNKKFLMIAGGIFVALIVSLVILVVVSNKNTAKKNAADASTLTIWNLGDEEHNFDSAIASFQNSHPSVKIVFVKKDLNNYLKESLAEIAAGKGPDIWVVPDDWMVKYHDQMTPMPDNLIAKKKEKKSDLEVYKQMYPQAIYDNNVYGEKIYGMPLSVDMLKLYLNTSVLGNTLAAYRKTNPNLQNDNMVKIFSSGPKNWDDVTAMISLLTKKDGNNITQSAIALGNTSNITNSVNILTLIMLQSGAKMTSDDKLSATFQTKQNVFGGTNYPGTSALQFYTSFSNPSNPNYTWNNSMSDSVRAFAESKAAMMIDFESKKDEIKRISPKLDFQTVDVPQAKETANPINYAKFNNFTVSKAAKDPNLAWQFIIMQSGTYLHGYLMETKKTSAKLSDNSNDPLKTLATWYNPDPEQTPEIFKTMINQVNEGKNAQTAIENAASQITTLLAKLKE